MSVVAHFQILFGRRVRKLRLKKKLSQERLAELAGLHVNFISRLERGQANASLATMVKIAKALRCKPGELFRGSYWPKTGDS